VGEGHLDALPAPFAKLVKTDGLDQGRIARPKPSQKKRFDTFPKKVDKYHCLL
jgi:hypothetical protein